MNPNTGETFDLRSRDDLVRALKAEEVVEVKEDEIQRLSVMNRADRRRELRDRPRIEREEIRKLLRERADDAS